MSKYIIKVLDRNYYPEGNYTKEREVYYQEVDDKEVISRVARAVNCNKSEAIAPATARASIEELLERALLLVRGRYLTKEQSKLVTDLMCYRDVRDDDRPNDNYQ